ncbi:hypothetical protein BHM03_00059237, partial [Ensete ventricosum]
MQVVRGFATVGDGEEVIRNAVKERQPYNRQRKSDRCEWDSSTNKQRCVSIGAVRRQGQLSLRRYTLSGDK